MMNLHRSAVATPLLVLAAVLMAAPAAEAQYDQENPWVAWEETGDWPVEIIPRNGGKTNIWTALHLWKERRADSRDEKSWEERILAAYLQLTGVPATPRFHEARTRWALTLLPLLLGGVDRDKADFLVTLTEPCDEIRAADEAARRGEAVPPVGWDVQLVHALALGRRGFVGDAERALAALKRQVELHSVKGGGKARRVSFLGEERSFAAVLRHLQLHRALLLSMRVGTSDAARGDASPATVVRPPDITPSSLEFLANQGVKESDAVPFDADLEDIPDRPDLLDASDRYMAIFEVDGNRLIAKAVRDDDAAEIGIACWKRLTTLFPAAYRRELVQFNIQKGRGTAGTFSGSGTNDVGRVGYRLSISRYRAEEEDGLRRPARVVTRKRGTLDWTLVHEMGHYICLRSWTIEAFSNEFEGRDDKPARRKNPRDYPADGSPRLDGDFVTSYAERAAVDEEVCETFTTYLLTPELPTNDSLAARKIRFFETIPGMTELRRHVQAVGGTK